VFASKIHFVKHKKVRHSFRTVQQTLPRTLNSSTDPKEWEEVKKVRLCFFWFSIKEIRPVKANFS
jgi:hypothetical protein